MLGPLLVYAGPAFLAAVTVLLGQTALRLLLVRGSGLGAAGHYQVADSLAQGLLLIPSAAAAAFMPAVSRERETGYAGLPGSLRRGLEQVLGYNVGLCLALIGIVPWVVVLLFGREFGPARPVLVLLAAAYGAVGPSMIFGAAMLGRGEVWTGVLVNLLWAVVMLGCFRFATGSLGAVGAALAALAGYLALLAACVGLVAPRWSVPVRGLLPSLLASLLSLAIGCALALSPGVPAPLTALVCAGLAAAVFARWGFPSIAQAGARWARGS
jgi:O-antigen/teichoic acid export membrane protein